MPRKKPRPAARKKAARIKAKLAQARDHKARLKYVRRNARRMDGPGAEMALDLDAQAVAIAVAFGLAGRFLGRRF